MINTKVDKKIPVVRIIDDDDVMRRSLVFLLEDEDWEVRDYKDAATFLEQDNFDDLGCLLLDLRMPNMSGLELQQHLQDHGIFLPIVFLSGHGDIDTAVHALKSGACDFLQKPVDDDRLITTLSNSIEKDRKRRQLSKKKDQALLLFGLLTSREKEVAELVAKGLMNKVIADKLGISERTVQIHKGVAMRKLHVKTSVDLLKLLQLIEKDPVPQSNNSNH